MMLHKARLFPLFFALISFLFLFPGCSKDEQAPPPEQRQKVTGLIKRPIQKPPEEKGTGRNEDKSLDSGSNFQEEGDISRDKPAEPVAEAGPSKDGGSKPPEPESGEAFPSAGENAAGYYVVRKGDTLKGIAGRNDVYGDPLKWPVLYRFNRDRLAFVGPDETVPEKKLREGLRLKIPRREEGRKRTERRWIINVLSSRLEAEIIPSALRLIREGYPVYLTRAEVKGEKWIRLRVGFYRSKKEAQAESKKIKAMLQFGDLWVTKVSTAELEEFAGYQENDRENSLQ